MIPPKHIRVRRFLSRKKIGDRFLAEEVAKGANLKSRTQAGNILKWQPEVRKRAIAPGSPHYEWELIAEVPV